MLYFQERMLTKERIPMIEFSGWRSIFYWSISRKTVRLVAFSTSCPSSNCKKGSLALTYNHVHGSASEFFLLRSTSNRQAHIRRNSLIIGYRFARDSFLAHDPLSLELMCFCSIFFKGGKCFKRIQKPYRFETGSVESDYKFNYERRNMRNGHEVERQHETEKQSPKMKQSTIHRWRHVHQISCESLKRIWMWSYGFQRLGPSSIFSSLRARDLIALLLKLKQINLINILMMFSKKFELAIKSADFKIHDMFQSQKLRGDCSLFQWMTIFFCVERLELHLERHLLVYFEKVSMILLWSGN